MKEKYNIARIIISIVALATMMITEQFVDIALWIRAVYYALVYILIGGDIVWRAVQGIFHGQWLDENFLMTIATIGAFSIGQFAEGVGVMIFYQVGEFFQQKALSKARGSISSLLELQTYSAHRLTDNGVEDIDSEEIGVGDILVVKTGERVPVDGVLTADFASLDTKALTGESMPVEVEKGGEVLSGAINLSKAFEMKATKQFQDSTVSKILDLIENATDNKSKSEKFITRFAHYYTPIVVALAFVICILPPLFDGLWKQWVFRGLTFLTISCPCALVISIPLSYFAGIGASSKRGVLVKGSNVLENLDNIDTIVCDKTGTLTTGKFQVVDVTPSENREEILSIAGQVELMSTHSIAQAITDYCGIKSCSYQVQELAGLGLVGRKDSEEVIVGKRKFLQDRQVQNLPDNEQKGEIMVAKCGQYLGSILLQDTIKSNAKAFVDDMHAQSKRVIMLTGDNDETAKSVSQTLGIDECYSSLLPQDKVSKLAEIMQTHKVAYVGDGINDAPSLINANVGIAMGGVGSDSAIECSDIVLTHDNLMSIVDGQKISRKVAKIVKENTIFALTIKFLALILSVFGIVNMWIAVLSDVGVAMLAILNAMRAGIIGDKSKSEQKQEMVA